VELRETRMVSSGEFIGLVLRAEEQKWENQEEEEEEEEEGEGVFWAPIDHRIFFISFSSIRIS
jgi:hypothetical protein